ncbi:MAG TPA: alpha-L-fucosidase [Acidobacteriaceae bacterium]
MNRRNMLLGTGAAMAALATHRTLDAQAAAAPGSSNQAYTGKSQPGDATRAARMEWWHAAKFGMFIHFGVYSSIMRHEWNMENEAPPIAEYMAHAKTFHPSKTGPREWAKLAKKAGMKYMVLTTKHHEGFCNFETKLTTYNAVQQGPGFDIVREYVNAARAEGLRVGFYYSLMDWHHPDGAKCATDEAARKRFVAYTHGLIREILTNYGKIDVLWYDVSWPLDVKGWESQKMNEMVFELQPGIIVNNRNKLDGDFSTPEQKIVAETGGRAWESCMTLNDSWGYQRADDDWKSSKTIVRNLISCARDGGNYLLNIGPKPDASIPEESVKVLTEVGEWLAVNGESIYGCDLCQPRRSNYASFTRKGNTLYMHIHFWPGDYVSVCGLSIKVKSAKLLKTGKAVQFEQDDWRVKFTGLPDKAPDYPVTTLVIECDGEPTQDNIRVRRDKPRDGV